MSVTIDDDRRLEDIARALREFAEVTVEPQMALLCAVGENLRVDPAFAIRMLGGLDGVPLRMVSQAASRRNVTVVMRDSDLPTAMSRLHNAWFAAPATRGAGRGRRGERDARPASSGTAAWGGSSSRWRRRQAWRLPAVWTSTMPTGRTSGRPPTWPSTSRPRRPCRQRPAARRARDAPRDWHDWLAGAGGGAQARDRRARRSASLRRRTSRSA